MSEAVTTMSPAVEMSAGSPPFITRSRAVNHRTTLAVRRSQMSAAWSHAALRMMLGSCAAHRTTWIRLECPVILLPTVNLLFSEVTSWDASTSYTEMILAKPPTAMRQSSLPRTQSQERSSRSSAVCHAGSTLSDPRFRGTLKMEIFPSVLTVSSSLLSRVHPGLHRRSVVQSSSMSSFEQYLMPRSTFSGSSLSSRWSVWTRAPVAESQMRTPPSKCAAAMSSSSGDHLQLRTSMQREARSRTFQRFEGCGSSLSQRRSRRPATLLSQVTFWNSPTSSLFSR
mmetsp:Transcript_90716/g.270757  ORF Transcript_90716/g.270757 Transcript_90716/m.270757 type:complete len:283 (+) Transcript_90716:388-1236(+)